MKSPSLWSAYDPGVGLVDHYARKYADEKLEAVPDKTRFAADRYAAVRLTLPRLLPAKPEILELGAGSGLIARMLIDDGLSFRRYAASELPGPRLELLRELEPLGIEAIEIDADRVGDIGRFDAVLMVALIEHLIDPLGALQRIRDVLKPGGFVWIDTPNLAKWTRRVKLAAGRFPSTASVGEGLITYEGAPTNLYDEGHLHYFTFSSLERMLVERCGYARVERHPYAFGHRSRFMATLAERAPGLMSDVCVTAHT